MGIGRFTFYDTPEVHSNDAFIVAEMKAIYDEFETYGYRRVGAELRLRGIVVNAKKVRRLMREHALNPKRRRRTSVSAVARYPNASGSDLGGAVGDLERPGVSIS